MLGWGRSGWRKEARAGASDAAEQLASLVAGCRLLRRTALRANWARTGRQEGQEHAIARVYGKVRRCVVLPSPRHLAPVAGRGKSRRGACATWGKCSSFVPVRCDVQAPLRLDSARHLRPALTLQARVALLRHSNGNCASISHAMHAGINSIALHQVGPQLTEAHQDRTQMLAS